MALGGGCFIISLRIIDFFYPVLLHVLFMKQQVRFPEDNRIYKMFYNLSVNWEKKKKKERNQVTFFSSQVTTVRSILLLRKVLAVSNMKKPETPFPVKPAHRFMCNSSSAIEMASKIKA